MIGVTEIVGLSLDFVLVATVITLVRKLIMESEKKMPREECEARFKLQEERLQVFTEKFLIKIDHLTDLFTDFASKK